MPDNTSSPSQKGRIFISYRRIDSAGYAGRIYDRLVAYFGEDAIFMDVDTIEGGTDFIKVLEDAVQSCDVLIALIGKQWLTIKDKDGKRRLDSPEDFVRIEIATALKRNIRVIPVLVDGVDMPQPTELPENLKALARRNALQVNHHSFNPDVYRLIEHSESALDEAEESRVMKAQALQVAREKAGGEKANRELAEKIARDKAAKDAIEKAQLEAEELARQKAIKEKAVHEAAEKAKREKAERQAARRDAIKNLLPKLVPFLRVIGILGIIIVLFWAGSWAVPKFIALVPTQQATSTVTQHPIAKATSTSSRIVPTKTIKSTSIPLTTPTETRPPTFVPPSNLTATNFCGENIYVFKSHDVFHPGTIEGAYISPDATFNLTGTVYFGDLALKNFVAGGYFLETTGPFHVSTYSGTAWAFVRYDNIQCIRFLQGANTVVLNRGTLKFEIANNATPTP